MVCLVPFFNILVLLLLEFCSLRYLCVAVSKVCLTSSQERGLVQVLFSAAKAREVKRVTPSRGICRS
jgi:hypothetical protein